MNFRTAARVAVHLVVSLAGCFVSVTGEAQRATYHDVDSMEAAIALFDGVAGGRMQVRRRPALSPSRSWPAATMWSPYRRGL
jgi:hypothetical protein